MNPQDHAQIESFESTVGSLLLQNLPLHQSFTHLPWPTGVESLELQDLHGLGIAIFFNFHAEYAPKPSKAFQVYLPILPKAALAAT